MNVTKYEIMYLLRCVISEATTDEDLVSDLHSQLLQLGVMSGDVEVCSLARMLSVREANKPDIEPVEKPDTDALIERIKSMEAWIGNFEQRISLIESERRMPKSDPIWPYEMTMGVVA